MTTLTERKRVAKAARLMKNNLAPEAAQPVSVLAKYVPAPPTPECAITWEGEGFVLTVREGQTLRIPATLEGLRALATNLRARAAAASSGATPRLGSAVYPTQFDVDNWLKVRANTTHAAHVASEEENRRIAEAAAEAAKNSDLGF